MRTSDNKGDLLAYSSTRESAVPQTDIRVGSMTWLAIAPKKLQYFGKVPGGAPEEKQTHLFN